MRTGVIRIVVWFCVSLIRVYQVALSPLFPPHCRFIPTCSQYAVESLERYGPFKGLYRTIRRLLRCHPFHSGGFDPV